ncbi:MAG: hypothetical protein ACK5HM_09460, partial [Gemmatimonas sp.]
MNEMRKLNGSNSATEPGAGSTAGPRAGSRAGSRAPFRTRLFAMLLLFALVPTVTVTLAWAGVATRTLSLFSARSAWERIAKSGDDSYRIVTAAPLTTEQRAALDA